MILLFPIGVILFIWGTLAFTDRQVCGPTTRSHSEVERFIREGKLRLNRYDDDMLTYNSIKHDPSFYYISRFSPVASWVPGVSEYRIAREGNRNGWRIKDGSDLHRMVKEEHNRLLTQ